MAAPSSAVPSSTTGAILGSFGFKYASQPGDSTTYAKYGHYYGIGLQKTLGILAATNFMGLLTTLLLPEVPPGKSLEEINNEIGDEEMMGEK